MAIKNITIWGVDPRVTTAYGQQCGLLALELRKLGYNVSIAAIGAKLKDQGRPWKSIPVRFVGGRGTHGGDVLAPVARQFKADLVLMLFDSFMMDARAVNALTLEGTAVAYWCPVDAFNMADGGLPLLYQGMLALAPRAVPIAMSRFGERMFRHDGHDPLYVPHMIDTTVFRPMNDPPGAARAVYGIPKDAFVITLVAANSERFRKNFPGQFDAFRRARQPNWLLLVHSYCRPDHDGWDLEWLAGKFGIADQVRFADPDRYSRGGYSQADLAAWYNLGDLHTQCTLAEGFGIPLIEAQACGLPVVTTDGSAMRELCGAGFAIPGEPIMNPGQRAEWVLPHRAMIAEAYTKIAATERTMPRVASETAREFALGYSVPNVMQNYWIPALKEIDNRREAAQ